MSDLEQNQERTTVDAFGESLKYSLCQQPVSSLAQLSDHLLGTDLAEKASFMEAPEPADFGSKHWHAQQLGSAAGTFIPFILTHSAVSRRFQTAASHVAMDAARLNQFERMSLGAARIKTAAVSGAVYSALFEPVHPDPERSSSLSSFVTEKAKHAGVSAATFGGLTAATLGLNETGLRLQGASRFGSWLLRNDITAGAIAGLPVGAANTQLLSLADGKGIASLADSIAGGYTFAMLGTALGGTQRLMHATLPMEQSVSSPAGQPRELRTIGSRDTGKYLSDQVLPDGTRQIVKHDGTIVRIGANGKANVVHSEEAAARQQELRARTPQQQKTEKESKPGRWVEPVEPDFSALPPHERPLNVGSRTGDQVAQEMSNFAAMPFTLDGKSYASVEGFYVALKWSHDPAKAELAGQMVGAEAKKFGKSSTATHATYQGKTFELGSPEHHALIKRAIQAKLEQNPDLARRFMATHPRPIIHDLGYPETKTNLPSADFARILTELRTDLIEGRIRLQDGIN